MSFVLVLNLQRIKDSFGLCYVFLCHFVCFIMYVTVHAALVRIKLMNNTYRKFGEVWTYGVWDAQADRQTKRETDIQTCSSQYFTSLLEANKKYIQ